MPKLDTPLKNFAKTFLLNARSFESTAGEKLATPSGTNTPTGTNLWYAFMMMTAIAMLNCNSSGENAEGAGVAEMISGFSLLYPDHMHALGYLLFGSLRVKVSLSSVMTYFRIVAIISYTETYYCL